MIRARLGRCPARYGREKTPTHKAPALSCVGRDVTLVKRRGALLGCEGPRIP